VSSTTSIGKRGGRLGPPRSRRRSALIAAACLALLTSLPATAADRHISQSASQGGRTSDDQLSSATQDGKTDEASSEILAGAAWDSGIRAAPTGTIPRKAIEREWATVASLPTVGGSWTELTTLPYQTEDPNYRTPGSFWGPGYGMVGGRVQALAVDGDTVYTGAAVELAQTEQTRGREGGEHERVPEQARSHNRDRDVHRGPGGPGRGPGGLDCALRH